MEHQVLVRLPARVVRQVLREPGLLARCVPGLTLDGPAAQGEPVTGRLRLRVAGATITYRGEFTTAWEGDDDGAVRVTAAGREARGTGEASVDLRIAVQESTAGGGVRLVVTGDLVAKGRLEELDPSAVSAAGQRMLERLASALAADPAAAGSAAADDQEASDGVPPEGGSDEADPFEELGSLDGLDDVDAPGAAEEPDPAETVDADLSALDSSRLLGGDLGGAAPADASGLVDGPVRRSIVGRSAEEVDHAPPRGRYAPALPARSARSARARAAARWSGAEGRPATPVVTPEADRTRATWMIGGGVALIGGAVALARVLRRR